MTLSWFGGYDYDAGVTFELELQGREAWIGLGVSPDGKMKGSEAVVADYNSPNHPRGIMGFWSLEGYERTQVKLLSTPEGIGGTDKGTSKYPGTWRFTTITRDEGVTKLSVNMRYDKDCGAGAAPLATTDHPRDLGV